MSRAVIVSDTNGFVGVGFLVGATPTLPHLSFPNEAGYLPSRRQRLLYIRRSGIESGHVSDRQSREVWGKVFPPDYLESKNIMATTTSFSWDWCGKRVYTLEKCWGLEGIP